MLPDTSFTVTRHSHSGSENVVYTLRTSDGDVIANLFIQADANGNPYVGTAVAEYLCTALKAMSDHYNKVNKATKPLVVGNIVVALSRKLVRSFTIKDTPGYGNFNYELSNGGYQYQGAIGDLHNSLVQGYLHVPVEDYPVTAINVSSDDLRLVDPDSGDAWDLTDIKYFTSWGYPKEGVDWFKSLVLPSLPPTDPKAFIISLLALSLDGTITQDEASVLLGTAYNGIINNEPTVDRTAHYQPGIQTKYGILRNLPKDIFTSLGRFPVVPVKVFKLAEICYGFPRSRSTDSLKELYNRVLAVSIILNSSRVMDITGSVPRDFTDINIRDFIDDFRTPVRLLLDALDNLDETSVLPFYGYSCFAYQNHPFNELTLKHKEKGVSAIAQAVSCLDSKSKSVLSSVAVSSTYNWEMVEAAYLAVNNLAYNFLEY